MNLVQFLKKVDDTVSDMTKEQLQSYVRELARTLPENKRQYFLDTMNAVHEEYDSLPVQTVKHYGNLHAEVREIEEILTNINIGDRCLDSEYNEEWDDWYNSDVEFQIRSIYFRIFKKELICFISVLIWRPIKRGANWQNCYLC